MPIEAAVAGLALAALIAYAVLGGADFGGGIWDLFARGSRRDAQRDAIAAAMGPVWEANHVWLIFVIVLIFTAFPRAYAALSIALYIPFHLVLLGITLRGAAFVFRAYSPRRGGVQRTPAERRWGALFGAASIVTPVLLGMCLGAISAGTVRVRGDVVAIMGAPAWLRPVALAMGALALALCAYLAAVYLINETEGELREDFRRRALGAGTFVVGLSVLALPLLRAEAPHLWEGLVGGPATPILAMGISAALLSGLALLRRWHRLARAAAVTQVASLLAGWGVAQAPYVIYPDLTWHDAAAPESTLFFVLITTPPGLAILLPSLWLLFRVFKGRETAVDSQQSTVNS
jgi:cytochrome d ubiquinol oxidase subunit II